MIKGITLIFIVFSISCGLAQEDRPLPLLIEFDTTREEPPEDLYFQKRMPNAVAIDARREVNKVSLVAKNSSLYPYTITVHFIESRNVLQVPDSTRSFVVYPGTDVLMNFRIFDPSQSFDFDFRADKKIGDSGINPVLDFPYLIPVGEHKSVHLALPNLNDTRDVEPAFRLSEGDSVYAMRKGVVTAVPATDQMIDRIASGSIEIRHADGTIMVYDNSDPSKVLVRPGETVYPGQPLGVASSAQFSVSLYQLQNEKPEPLRILFYVDDNTIVPFSEIPDHAIVHYPLVIVGKEMNRKELKRMKGK